MIRKILWGITVLFIAVNLIAFMHAYRFTHFTSDGQRTPDPARLSSLSKAKLLFTGISNPKPMNKILPQTYKYNTVQIQSDVKLEGWHFKVARPKGTVILFHGYTGEKSMLLSRAEIFMKAGFNTLLVDLMGSGGSEGLETHLGYTESVEVQDCVKYIQSTGEKNIHLFGTSMGAVAILKAFNDYPIDVNSIIVECPFGSMYKTVAARFQMMGVPAFPMAGILTFWGGVQLGFWGFSHNPAEYANQINIPLLLLFGEKDDRVSMEETTEIFSNLKGDKNLVTYPELGHDVFSGNEIQWEADVMEFIQ
jgi:uncharacterized protein